MLGGAQLLVVSESAMLMSEQSIYGKKNVRTQRMRWPDSTGCRPLEEV
jgi:hypothetical protein